jgi:hypothetical protein
MARTSEAAFDFTLMDRLVDFAVYERALRDGRAVVMVHVHGDAPKAATHQILKRHGGHFINYYGRFATRGSACGADLSRRSQLPAPLTRLHHEDGFGEAAEVRKRVPLDQDGSPDPTSTVPTSSAAEERGGRAVAALMPRPSATRRDRGGDDLAPDRVGGDAHLAGVGAGRERMPNRWQPRSRHIAAFDEVWRSADRVKPGSVS